jgi:hypothetical protein
MKYVAALWGSVGALNPGARWLTATSRSGSSKASGFSNTPYTTLKMAVVAPIPSASVRTATAEKPGCFQNIRAA